MTKKQTKKTLERELKIAVELAGEVSEAILPFYYGSVEKKQKADGTPVTESDTLANKIILQGLQKAFPADAVRSEELGYNGIIEENNSGILRTWYVDPIDGTKGFIGHSDQFAIHIGLAKQEWDYDLWKKAHRAYEGSAWTPGKAIFGLVYKPTTGEYYFGGSGIGAWRVHPDGSRKELQVAGERESLCIVTNTSFLQEQAFLMEKLKVNKVYVSGSLGLRAMCVAGGMADVYLKEDKHSGGTWDLCAPQAIVEAAGGYVAYADGTPVRYSGQSNLEGRLVIARNETVGKYVSEMMEKYVEE